MSQMNHNLCKPEEQIELSPAVDEFIKNCRARNLSQHTVEWYRMILRQFMEFSQDLGYSRLDDISSEVLNSYVLSLKERKVRNRKNGGGDESTERGLKIGSINGHIRAIKTFFNYLYQQECLSVRVGKSLRQLRSGRKFVDSFSSEQVLRLLDVADRRSFAGHRDYVALAILYGTGLRLNELLNLRIGNINWELEFIKVKGKGNKERHVPLSDHLKKILSEYIKRLPPGGRERYLICTGDGGRLSNRSFQKRLKEYGKKAGIEGVRVSPHTFRHTFAKDYILNGGDPFSLQQILGHSSLDMVRRYVDLVRQELVGQYKKFSPLDRLFKQAGENDKYQEDFSCILERNVV